ncbi:hypothetical protein CEXT_789211 [Caerostris extrusa]|uniref:Uncharacterized protein n=1 Tax=Caerostris extrusa TaxID=172846 RepID=A0AAV4NL53_CAEEX|nr:hypothetical protein CEXT_789211 [Caerostris extrusa]
MSSSYLWVKLPSTPFAVRVYSQAFAGEEDLNSVPDESVLFKRAVFLISCHLAQNVLPLSAVIKKMSNNNYKMLNAICKKPESITIQLLCMSGLYLKRKGTLSCCELIQRS